MPRRPENLYPAYHAHVYFDEASLDQARALCTGAGKTLSITVGRIHSRNVGPHPHWSCQLSFNKEQFDKVINYLEEHRHGLDILVHGVTGDDLADHTDHAAWLGEASVLNLEVFQ
ncbi:MAG: DOPA 4,5-dioxygenase family protein [Gammaproteobacteria bacterium]|nr:DOPA 4,5-dioxygenase family protein [Gammaproteobacteria bacterium]